MDRRAALRTLLAFAAGALLAPPARARARRIRVGVLPGPDARVMKAVQDVAARQGLALELVTLSDPSRLNAAVSAGALDANACQDRLGLDADVAAHGHALAAVAPTITLPLAFYSRKVRSLREVNAADTIALPEERAAAARALILLHNYGLLQLREDAGLAPSAEDVTANPRKLKLVSIASGRLAEALASVTAAAMTYPTAQAAGLEPARDSIAMEDGRAPHAHVLVTRARDRGEPWVEALVRACHSDEVRDFILTEFRDSVRRAW